MCAHNRFNAAPPRPKSDNLLLPGAQTDPEGGFWKDPPQYWEQIVWPAYVAAHEGIVESGNVEDGKSNGKVEGLEIIEGLEKTMDETVEFVCEKLAQVL